MYNTASERNDFRWFVVATVFVLVIGIVALVVGSVTHKKTDASLIRLAIEQKTDLSQVRCLLNPLIAGCDTVNLVRELRVERTPMTTPVPSVVEPAIQP